MLDKQEQKLFGTNYVFYDIGTGAFEDKTLTQGREKFWKWVEKSLEEGQLFYLIQKCEVRGGAK